MYAQVIVDGHFVLKCNKEDYACSLSLLPGNACVFSFCMFVNECMLFVMAVL